MTLPNCYRCGSQPCTCKDGIVLIHGDCLEVMAGMEAGSVDAVVTDPPYGLKFMGKLWDHGVPGVEFWRQCLSARVRWNTDIPPAGLRDRGCWLGDSGYDRLDLRKWIS